MTARTAPKKRGKKKSATRKARSGVTARGAGSRPNKTAATRASVRDFLAAVPDEVRRRDARTLATLFRRVTGERPRMWGPSIVGYGRYRYRYASGREGEWMRTGFSPRRQNLVVYLMDGFSGHGALLKQLGKHKTGRSCLYLNKLEDVDLEILEQIVRLSVAEMARRYPD